MRKLTNKKIAAIAVAAVALTGTGVAYAYWTTTGSGTGSAVVGTDADNLTITASSQGGDLLVPGGAKVPLQFDVLNTNPTTASLQGLTLSISNVMCGTTEVDDDWFSIVDSTVTSAEQIETNAVGSEENVQNTGVTIQMENSTENQNPCKSVQATFDLSVTDPDYVTP